MASDAAYTTAVDMFQREHRRWIENAVVLFSAIASLFALYSKLEDTKSFPISLLYSAAALVSLVTVFVATSVRGSTDAWAYVVRQIECDADEDEESQPFKMYSEYIDQRRYGCDLLHTLWILYPPLIFLAFLIVTTKYFETFVGAGLTIYFFAFYFSHCTHFRLPGLPPRPDVFSVTRWYTLLAVFAAITFGCLAWCSSFAQGEVLISATVTRVVDGDTIVVIDSSNQQREIRLEGIDAPEHGQAFGEQSTVHLIELVRAKEVKLDCTGQQSYGRFVCKVFLPSDEDVDLDQIKAGMAWHYKQFQRLQNATDRTTYGVAEDAARRAHLGLWSQSNPVQPQDFRHHTASQVCFDNADHRIACSDTYDGPVRGNLHSHIYHWPGCPNYDDIAEHNRVELPNAVAAEAAGFRAARNCP
jgi:endonuclease YncB( thermonuclease family)